jgi:NTE family protein
MSNNNTIDNPESNNSTMSSNVHRALIFQGGGSLGAYEAGAYKAISEELSVFIKKHDREKKGEEEPTIFHIVSGTSIGAINAAILVSYVKENRTWEGSGQRLIDFWKYLSTHSNVENMNPYFAYYWEFWHRLDNRIASGESVRRYYSTKEFIFSGVPSVFRPKIPKSDNRFFDPSNTWYVYDNEPLKQSLEKFAKFPISTNFENNEPRLLLVAVDIQEGVPVVFDSYEKKDGSRKSGYGGFNEQAEDHNSSSGEFEHVIRYDDGITSDFVLASSSVPVNYEYTKLNVEDHKLLSGPGSSHDSKENIAGSDKYSSSSSYSNSNTRFFWDGGLLANTPLRQTVIAHRDYWYKVRKMEDNLPSLSIGIINLHPLKQEYVSYDYDGVVDRKNDIMYHDRTQFDEYVAVLISDFQKLSTTLIKLSKDNGVSEKSLQTILHERIKTINPNTGQRLRYDDLLKARVDIDFVIRLERKNDSHTISNKIFDFSKTTIRQLVYDGYEETEPQIKRILNDAKQ